MSIALSGFSPLSPWFLLAWAWSWRSFRVCSFVPQRVAFPRREGVPWGGDVSGFGAVPEGHGFRKWLREARRPGFCFLQEIGSLFENPCPGM